MPRKSFHERKLAEYASGVLDEPPGRLAFFDDVEGLLHQFDAELCLIGLRLVGPVASSPVGSDGGDTERGTRRRGPKDMSSSSQEIVVLNFSYVG